MVNLHLSQKKIINKIKKYFKKLKTQKIDISKSSFCYFNTYSDSPGYALGNLWNKKINKIEFFSYILKNIYSIFFISNYEISNLSNYKYENIIVTWGRHKDFKKNVFKDSFSNISSNSIKKTLFFVIYMDLKIPKNMPKNVLLFSRNKTKINILFFFKKMMSIYILNNFSIKKFIHYFSSQTIFAEEIQSKLFSTCNILSVRRIIMPYEGQPYQNYIFNESKKINKKIKTIGFIHSMIPALPINFIKRDGSPDKLFLTGKAQFDIFFKFLNWKKDNLKIIYSPRISKYIDKKNVNSIFFPIKINNRKLIIKVIEKFIISKKDKYFKNIIVKKHPSSFNSIDQNALYNDIINILNKNKKKFDNKSKVILNFFIGPTSAFIQYLENNLSCIHITNNPVFDVYSFGLWKKLFPKQINEYMYNYTLNEQNKMILLKNKTNQFLLKNIL